ncbi:MAG: acetylornithine deacetylase [Planctomycetes bacterium]|nr:acetylornithine deacetylase [Planctomycetota bacterium]
MTHSMIATLSNAELLARLVSYDSTSTKSNVPIADFVCEYLDRPGIDVLRHPDADGTKVNLIARIDGRGKDTKGGGVDPDGLVLCGHLDVVPACEPEWRTDPFSLVDDATHYFGRGSCDMKGFVALAMNAMCLVCRDDLTHPLMLLLTHDEEVGLLGAKRLAAEWQQTGGSIAGLPVSFPRSVIVGEPTSLRAVRMHKGLLEMRVTVRGVPAHSGYPHLGRSAIEPAARIVAGLAALRSALEEEGGPNVALFPETPFVALNVGRITGGTAVNIVPDRCVIELSVRLLPGMEAAPFVERVRNIVADAAGSDDADFEFVHDSPPMLLAEGAPVHRTLCDLLSQSRSYGVSYATDAGALQAMGLDCVLCGPGTIEVAHKPNESLPKDEFRRAAELIETVVKRFCKE